MKALKIVGIVFGILLLLTGGGLAVGSVAGQQGPSRIDEELAKTGYAGPVDGTVQSVDQTSPVIVTVTYTDTQGKHADRPGRSRRWPATAGRRHRVDLLQHERPEPGGGCQCARPW